jgi:hypothetical protein
VGFFLVYVPAADDASAKDIDFGIHTRHLHTTDISNIFFSLDNKRIFFIVAVPKMMKTLKNSSPALDTLMTIR